MFRQLDEKTLVAGQIGREAIEEAKRLGVTMIINNRPDGEEAGQPLGADIERASEDAGILYRFVPIIRGIGPADVEAMNEAMREGGDGKILCFCRSGTRSALAWALVKRSEGVSRQAIERQLSNVGINPAPIAHLL